MICPKCEFAQPDGHSECLRCGVIFSKIGSEAGKSPREPVAEEGAQAESPASSRLHGTLPEIYDGSTSTPGPVTEAPGELARVTPIDREGRIAWAIGLVSSALILAVPFTRFVVSYLGVLVHELGHSAASWIFGYPAIPAFDFTYGGGVSISFERNRGLVLAIVALWGFLLWFYRGVPRMLGLLAALFGLWVLLAATPLHEALGIAMGHGAELLIAGIFLYRAASGSGCQVPQVERPLYAMLGWFLVLEQSWFAWGLLTDPGKRQLYADAKGGGHWMDFSRLALDYVHVPLETVAGAFLLCCLLTPLAAWVLLRHGRRLLRWGVRWLAR